MQPKKFALALVAFFAVTSAPPAATAPLERRLALVIGNASYKSGSLATPANDAGLIAQSLQAAGFDVIGARDLDQSSLREAFQDFVAKASEDGPDTLAAVYFAGYGLQFEGENYLLPTNASIVRAQDIPAQALRVSDYMRALAALRLKATIVVLDAARASPFSIGGGQPLASGLAWARPESGMLIAFNAMPGTVAGRDQQGYGPYAKALAEMLRAGGFSPATIFERVRLRVNELTNGGQVPWDASNIENQVNFFEAGPDAPPRKDSPDSMRSRPMGDLGAQDAYLVALLRDTFDGYGDYLAAYSRDPLARRVRAILALRREAITWRLSYQDDTSEAYWSYLMRYPRGPHAPDARRLLAHLGATLEPPHSFATIDFEVPSPLPGESEYLERPVLAFDDPVFAFAPTPPLPAYFLEPTPPDLAGLESPSAPREAHNLPVPVFVPVPAYINAPAYVAAPPNPFIFNNIHNRVVTNTTTHIATITKPDGQTVSAALTMDAGGTVAAGSDVPPSVAPKAAPINSQAPSAANPGTIGEITPMMSLVAPQLTVNQPTSSATTLSKPTTAEKPPANPLVAAAPPVNGNTPLTTPPVAALSPLIDKIPLPIPRAAGRPQTGDSVPSNPPVAALSPPTTDSPSPATLLPPTIGNVRLPVPRPAPSSPPAADLSVPITDIIPLPTPRPTPVSRRSPVPLASSPVVQPPLAIVHPAPAPPPPSPRSALQAPAHPLSPPTPPKPRKTICQIVNDQQVCKQGVTQ